MSEMRADRMLSELGIATRSEAKKLIRAGRLKKDGETVTRPETKLDPERDSLTVDGRPVSMARYEYWILNKPKGIITATEDRFHETVLSYMGLKRKGLSPCGRLDIDTEGLLLVTNDGGLIHRLLSPVKHVDKQYEVWYEGVLPEDAEERIAAGLQLSDGFQCLPAELLKRGSGAEKLPAVLKIREGKFHQVKRMFASLGCKVTDLKRTAMGPLTLQELNLAPGTFRRLTEEEVRKLKDTAGEDAEPLPKAIIFDLDGTLVDSMWMWYDIDVEYLKRYGHTCPADLQAAIAGMGFTETAYYFKERFQIPDSIETIKKDWEAMSLELYRTKVPLKPGALKFLRFMKQKGVKLGIATSNGEAMVEAVLNSLGIRDMFDHVVTACSVAKGKPSPDIYLRAAELLGADPSDCLVFEDIPEGIIAGKRAGMAVIAVRDDHSKALEGEKEALSDRMIGSYEELLEEISKS